MDLPFWGLMAGLVVLYVLLGCFLDAISMMILTMPFVAPLITAHGQSLVWFGVFVSMMIVIGAVTPPLGLNCYVMKAAMGKEVELNEIFSAPRRSSCSCSSSRSSSPRSRRSPCGCPA